MNTQSLFLKCIIDILFVGWFVFVRDFVLVWLVKIAFSSQETKEQIFMLDHLVFYYCELKRSDFKKERYNLTLCLFVTQQELISASQVTNKIYKAATRATQ